MSHTISYMLRPALRKIPPKLDMSLIILDTVCAFYGIDKRLVLGKKRDREICMCRHVTTYLLKNYTNLTLKEIGRLLGNRDHTTALNSLRQMRGWMTIEENLMDEIRRLEIIIAPPTLKNNTEIVSMS